MVMVFLAAIFIVAFHRNKLISMNYLDASVEVSKDDPPVTFGDIPLFKGDKIEKPFHRRWYRLPPLIRGDVRRTGGILPRSKLRGILRLKDCQDETIPIIRLIMKSCESWFRHPFHHRIPYFSKVFTTLAPARSSSRTVFSPLTFSQARAITSSAISRGTTTTPSTSP